jgi:hypothetical protein
LYFCRRVSYCWFFFAEVSALHEKESQLKYNPTLKEINAGINEFNEYGPYNYIYQLTGGDPLKEEAFFNLPWSTVFMYRKISFHNSIYSRRLNGVREEE